MDTFTGICLQRKLSLFSNISQNSILEKWTLHKIQYRKNRLFTKFNVQARKFQPFSGISALFLKKPFQATFQINEIMGMGSSNFEQFLIVSALISYCWWGVIVFWEFDALWSRMLVLSSRKSRMWLIFYKIIYNTRKSRT